jgi:hypothetical protein
VAARFAYYGRLDAANKAIYRKSDAISAIAIRDAAALAPLVRTLEESLASGKRTRVAAATTALTAALLAQLGVAAPRVRVRVVRPHIEGGELHGLYTFARRGKEPEIEVWMRTAANARVVRFKTFLRTLLHEICHHLDLTAFGLSDSFHTAGFFRRESSLVRQLTGGREPRTPKGTPARAPAPRQLPLF